MYRDRATGNPDHRRCRLHTSSPSSAARLAREHGRLLGLALGGPQRRAEVGLGDAVGLRRRPCARIIAFVFLPILALLATSCATTGFKEAKATDLEIRFNTWDSITITKPDTREGGFLPVLQLSELGDEIAKRVISRELAVVVVVNNYDESQAASIGAKMKGHLAAHGFKRVVALRGSDVVPIAGLPVAFDSAIQLANGQNGFSSASASSAP